jgi:hypothetical protein
MRRRTCATDNGISASGHDFGAVASQSVRHTCNTTHTKAKREQSVRNVEVVVKHTCSKMRRNLKNKPHSFSAFLPRAPQAGIHTKIEGKNINFLIDPEVFANHAMQCGCTPNVSEMHYARMQSGYTMQQSDSQHTPNVDFGVLARDSVEVGP